MMITAGSVHIVLADPQHCDQTGWPTCYSAGYQDGLANPGSSCPSGHSDNFCRGWDDGASSGGSSVSGSPPTVTPSVPSGSPENFASECNAIQGILVQSCSQLVNPDGTLTVPDGTKANTCIRNGIALGLGGFIASGFDITSLPLIKTGLQILSKQTGCDGVVNWDNLDLSQLTLLKRIFH